MIRQVCNVKPENVGTVTRKELLFKTRPYDLEVIFRENGLRWFGSLEEPIRTAYESCTSVKDAVKITWRVVVERHSHSLSLRRENVEI